MSRSEIGHMWIGRDDSVIDPARIARTTRELLKGLTPMGVRAKFKVTEIKQASWQGEGRTVTLSAQYDPTIPEDQRYAKATPSGHLEMQIDNPAALEQLPLGKDFYLDITPVHEPVNEQG